eukprot:238192_1
MIKIYNMLVFHLMDFGLLKDMVLVHYRMALLMHNIHPSSGPWIHNTQSGSFNLAIECVATFAPIATPTHSPTMPPTNAPSLSVTPSAVPSLAPSVAPSLSPSIPSNSPSINPTNAPSYTPSLYPSHLPSNTPTNAPPNASTNAPSNAQKIPYTFIDFDYIHSTGIWENRNIVRAQVAYDGNVTLDTAYTTTTTNDNNNEIVGAFLCDNQKSGNVYSTPNTAAYIHQLKFNEYALEVIVKPTKNNVTFHGYIIGIEGTFDTIQGNSISYNEIYNYVSPEPDKFFPSNFYNDGWIATNEYWESIKNTESIDINQFHHVIVSQNSAGAVSVYVDGARYGDSYLVTAGPKNNSLSHAAFHIKLCGDNNEHIGFDGYIRAFGFYTEAFSSSDAYDACQALNGMIECQTGNPTIAPTSITSVPSNSPTTSPSNSPTQVPTNAPTPLCPNLNVNILGVVPFDKTNFEGVYVFQHDKIVNNRPVFEVPQLPNDKNIQYVGIPPNGFWVIEGYGSGTLSYGPTDAQYPPTEASSGP